MLISLSLHNFRNHKKADFSFDSGTTVIIGPNGSGKTNLIEAISMLALGKSKKAEKDQQLIRFTEVACQVKGKLSRNSEEDLMEVLLGQKETGFLQKKYLVNGVAKRRVDFAGNLLVVHFSPVDLDMIAGQPSQRRKFLDDVLEQTDFSYRNALTLYFKALKQRNALLEQVQELGVRDEKLFSYWDELLITHGNTITNKRAGLIHYLNEQKKTLFPFSLGYDSSTISRERLLQYKNAEVGAGVTLVGPHRDDVIIETETGGSSVAVRHFASRGQQRLVALEMKLMQLAYIARQMDEKPLLLLDDIFSELDGVHIEKILSVLPAYQTIITTTHREFVPERMLTGAVIELGR